jgi:hypothetical protein
MQVTSLIDTNFTYNYFPPINKTIQIVFSIGLVTYPICGFTHFNSFVDYIYTFFYYILPIHFFPYFELSLVIRIYGQNSLFSFKTQQF